MTWQLGGAVWLRKLIVQFVGDLKKLIRPCVFDHQCVPIVKLGETTYNVQRY